MPVFLSMEVRIHFFSLHKDTKFSVYRIVQLLLFSVSIGIFVNVFSNLKMFTPTSQG